MQLTVINCSPRRKKSNTSKILKYFLRGFHSVEGNESQVYFADDLKEEERAREVYLNSEVLLIAFPLYNNSLTPAGIRFLKSLEALRGKKNSTKMAFLMQYGFIEGAHGRFEERLLGKAADALGAENLGVIVKGGCEALAAAPEFFMQSLLKGFEKFGRQLALDGRFNPDDLKKFAQPEGDGKKKKKSKLFIWTSNTFYWKATLRKNGMLDQHSAQPLLDK